MVASQPAAAGDPAEAPLDYPTLEKLEIIRLVEQFHLPVGATLDKLGITRLKFYRWYDSYQRGGPGALKDHPSQPSRCL